MNLGTDQVVKALVVDTANENLSRVCFSSLTVNHDFTTGVGKSISKGEKVAVLEAMKMQTTLYASADGAVDDILVQVGDSVESKDLIARLR